MNLLGVELNNVVGFKKARLPLNKTGIFTIRGLNLNARSKQQTNATGKSVLTSAICNLLREGPPMSTNRREKKSMLEDGSTIIVWVKVGDDNYKLIQQMNRQSLRYTVIKNGQDLKIRTTPLAEKFISDLQPWNDVEFYTTKYLDGRKPFIFQVGTDVQRLSFITDLFHLEEHDRVRRLLLDLKDSKKQDAAKLSVLETEMIRSRRDLKESKWKKELEFKVHEDERRLRKLKEKYKKITALVQASTIHQQLIERKKHLQEQIDQHSSVIGRWTLKEVNKEIDSHEQWTRYTSLMEHWSSQYSILTKKLAKLESKTKGHSVSAKELSSIEKLIGRMSIQIESLTSVQEEVNSQLENMRSRYKELSDVKPLSLDKEQTIARIEQLKQISKLGSVVDKGHKYCPTCGSTIHAVEILRRAKKAASQLKDLDEKLTRFDKWIELQSIISKGKELRSKFDEHHVKQLKTLNKKYSDLHNQRESIAKILDTSQSIKDLKSQISNLGKPTKPNSDKPNSTLKELGSIRASIKQAKVVSEALKKVEEDLENSDTELSDKDVGELLKTQKDLNSKIYELNSVASDNAQRKALWDSAMNRLSKQEKEHKVLSESLTDLPIIEGLIYAYSNKGLKVVAAQTIARSIESAMNREASRIFVEPVKFRLTVTVNRFGIEYKMGKRKWTDVRRLSGAESRSFACLVVATLIPMLPATRRSNFIVFDEMDANMSEETRKLFATDYLPWLNTMIPTVVVVTPDTRTPYPGRNMLVTKQGAVSTLTTQQSGHR